MLAPCARLKRGQVFGALEIFKANSADPVTYPTLLDELSTFLRVKEFLPRSL